MVCQWHVQNQNPLHEIKSQRFQRNIHATYRKCLLMYWQALHVRTGEKWSIEWSKFTCQVPMKSTKGSWKIWRRRRRRRNWDKFQGCHLESAVRWHSMARCCWVFAGTGGGRNVDTWIAIKEVGSLELEPNVLYRHYWEILYPNSMRDAEAVPDDGIIACHRSILHV